MAFGNVSFTNNTDNSADITWRCTRDSVTTIELGAGTSGDVANQYMTGPGGSRLPNVAETDDPEKIFRAHFDSVKEVW